jgi:hypothetical protein
MDPRRSWASDAVKGDAVKSAEQHAVGLGAKWDSHPLVKLQYQPHTQQQDMSQPLSSYFVSSGHNR